MSLKLPSGSKIHLRHSIYVSFFKFVVTSDYTEFAKQQFRISGIHLQVYLIKRALQLLPSLLSDMQI